MAAIRKFGKVLALIAPLVIPLVIPLATSGCFFTDTGTHLAISAVRLGVPLAVYVVQETVPVVKRQYHAVVAMVETSLTPIPAMAYPEQAVAPGDPRYIRTRAIDEVAPGAAAR